MDRLRLPAGLLLVVAAAAGVDKPAVPLTPERILQTLDVGPGSTVCEIGAGDGSLSVAAARLVGAAGRVYTNELGEGRVAKLREKMTESALAQITVVAGDTTNTNFPEAACDAILMRDVYHHFSNPAAMNRSIRASLRPGGRVAVVDFSPPQKEAARAEDRDQDGSHGVRPETVIRELKEAGFTPVSSEVAAGKAFIVVLSKTAQ